MVEIVGLDSVGRRIYANSALMAKICTCTKGWSWTANPKGSNFVWVHDKCMKPSRYSAIEICDECEKAFFWDRVGLRWACPKCSPEEIA